MKIGCPDGSGNGPNSKNREAVGLHFVAPQTGVDLSCSALVVAQATLRENGEVMSGVDCCPSDWGMAREIMFQLNSPAKLGADKNLTDGGWMVYGRPVSDG